MMELKSFAGNRPFGSTAQYFKDEGGPIPEITYFLDFVNMQSLVIINIKDVRSTPMVDYFLTDKLSYYMENKIN